ncbi:Btb/Poz Domain-Containing Protein 18, partial [Manis pentadactyla]
IKTCSMYKTQRDSSYGEKEHSVKDWMTEGLKVDFLTTWRLFPSGTVCRETFDGQNCTLWSLETPVHKATVSLTLLSWPDPTPPHASSRQPC